MNTQKEFGVKIELNIFERKKEKGRVKKKKSRRFAACHMFLKKKGQDQAPVERKMLRACRMSFIIREEKQ
jgi:hypothetical protein